MIDLITAKNSNKIRSWIDIINSNSGSGIIRNNGIFITSHIFIQLLEQDIYTPTMESKLWWMQAQQRYLSQYEYTYISY